METQHKHGINFEVVQTPTYLHHIYIYILNTRMKSMKWMHQAGKLELAVE